MNVNTVQIHNEFVTVEGLACQWMEMVDKRLVVVIMWCSWSKGVKEQ